MLSQKITQLVENGNNDSRIPKTVNITLRKSLDTAAVDVRTRFVEVIEELRKAGFSMQAADAAIATFDGLHHKEIATELLETLRTELTCAGYDIYIATESVR